MVDDNCLKLIIIAVDGKLAGSKIEQEMLRKNARRRVLRCHGPTPQLFLSSCVERGRILPVQLDRRSAIPVAAESAGFSSTSACGPIILAGALFLAPKQGYRALLEM